MHPMPATKEARAFVRVTGRLRIRADRRLSRIWCRKARWYYRTERS